MRTAACNFGSLVSGLLHKSMVFALAWKRYFSLDLNFGMSFLSSFCHQKGIQKFSKSAKNLTFEASEHQVSHQSHSCGRDLIPTWWIILFGKSWSKLANEFGSWESPELGFGDISFRSFHASEIVFCFEKHNFRKENYSLHQRREWLGDLVRSWFPLLQHTHSLR